MKRDRKDKRVWCYSGLLLLRVDCHRISKWNAEMGMDLMAIRRFAEVRIE